MRIYCHAFHESYFYLKKSIKYFGIITKGNDNFKKISIFIFESNSY